MTVRIPPSPMVVRSVVSSVSKQMMVSAKDIIEGSCLPTVVAARGEVIRQIYAINPARYSKAGIGRALGVHHSTVIYHLAPESYRKARNAQAMANYRSKRTLENV